MNFTLGLTQSSDPLGIARRTGGIETFGSAVRAMDGGSGFADSRHPPSAGARGRVRRHSRKRGTGVLRDALDSARHSAAVHASGGGLRALRGGQERGGGHAHGQRQDAVLQPAGAEAADRRAGRARHVPVPHQGAGRGSACTNSRRRWTPWAPISAPSLTTATRRRTRAAPSASAPTWC